MLTLDLKRIVAIHSQNTRQSLYSHYAQSFYIPPTNLPFPAKQTLLTLYDLPSEDSKESGLPDEFHDLQPQRLSMTCRLVDYSRDRVFIDSDLNLIQPFWSEIQI